MLHLNSGAKRRRSLASTSSYGLFRPQINVTVDWLALARRAALSIRTISLN
jgi:hypothetical protein